MLVIRMQRTGRKGHAQFRVVVQDSRRTPSSGKIVAQLGSYNPHSKQIILDKEKASFYLTNGAQPSGRAARLLQAEGIKLPEWVKLTVSKERAVRNADKRRSTTPPAPVEEAPAAAEPEETAAEEAPAEAAPEAAASDTIAEEATPPAETPAAEAEAEPSEDEAAPEATADAAE